MHINFSFVYQKIRRKRKKSAIKKQMSSNVKSTITHKAGILFQQINNAILPGLRSVKYLRRIIYSLKRINVIPWVASDFPFHAKIIGVAGVALHEDRSKISDAIVTRRSFSTFYSRSHDADLNFFSLIILRTMRDGRASRLRSTGNRRPQCRWLNAEAGR